ncbi:MAG: PhzF family phenazine biosynthesis protein [Oceanospirillaceae bacterium]|nr:PhzF family phenazine biosynthesis protein [Oceanospirillaceae bacterium]
MKGKLVDVFSKKKLCGNGLTIFYDYESLSNVEMLALTQEMRQFESVFVKVDAFDSSIRAKIYTVEEELDFAGHPIIGLAAHLHEESGDENPREWNINLNKKSVLVRTKKDDSCFYASMAQGAPEYIRTLTDGEEEKVLSALNLSASSLAPYLMEVISTGLPYLIVPIINGIEDAEICVPNFELFLETLGAKFVYVFDIVSFEGRTWNNDGSIEDIATGSAAGPVAAFLTKNELVPYDSKITISQGRFVGRPSRMNACVETSNGSVSNIWISGDVVKVASISFE